jgi:Arc/MetJ-type ribon-helix-helix transcriptional regulator
MPRRNLAGTWGAHAALSVRLTAEDRREIEALRERWGCATDSEVLRLALREAARPRPDPAKLAALDKVADLALEHGRGGRGEVRVRAVGWLSDEVSLTVAELQALLDAAGDRPT